MKRYFLSFTYKKVEVSIGDVCKYFVSYNERAIYHLSLKVDQSTAAPLVLSYILENLIGG